MFNDEAISARQWWTEFAKALLIFLGVLVVFQGSVVWLGEVFCGGDIVNQDHPKRVYWLEHGFWTNWFAPTFSGYPFFGDIQAGRLYAPHLLYWIGLAPEKVTTLLVLLHMLFGGLGLYAFLRDRLSFLPAVVAGALWIVCGYQALRLTNGVIIFTYGLNWLPWMWWAAERSGAGRPRWTVALGLLGAMQFFAGAPQLVHITWGGLALWKIGQIVAAESNRERLAHGGHFIAAGLLMAVLIFPQLFASQQFSSQGMARGGDSDWAYLTKDSLEPRTLLTSIVPEYFFAGYDEGHYWGSKQGTGFHESNNYVGVVTLVLGLFGAAALWLAAREESEAARRRLLRRWLWTLLAVGVLGLLIAFGRYTPFYRVLYAVVPGFALFRVPARWQIWTAAAAIALAAWGFEFLLSRSREGEAGFFENKPWLLALGVPTGVVAVALLILYAATPSLLEALGIRNPPFSKGEENVVEAKRIAQNATMMAFAFAAGAGLAGVALLGGKLNRRIGVGLVVGILAFDLFGFWRPFVRSIPTDIPRVELPSEAPFHRIAAAEFEEYFYPETPLVQDLREFGEGRILYSDFVLSFYFDQYTREIFGERPAVHGMEVMRGYQPLILGSYAREFYTLGYHSPDQAMPGSFLFMPEMVDRTMADAYNADLYLTYGEDDLDERFGLERIKQYPFGLQLWRNPHAAGWAWIATDEEWPGLDNRLAGASVETVEREPGRMVFELAAPDTNAWLHLSVPAYPNWHATVEPADRSGPAEELRGARSIAIPGGEGDLRVTYEYRLPGPVRAGLLISLLTALGAVVFIAFPRKTPETRDDTARAEGSPPM